MTVRADQRPQFLMEKEALKIKAAAEKEAATVKAEERNNLMEMRVKLLTEEIKTQVATDKTVSGFRDESSFRKPEEVEDILRNAGYDVPPSPEQQRQQIEAEFDAYVAQLPPGTEFKALDGSTRKTPGFLPQAPMPPLDERYRFRMAGER